MNLYAYEGMCFLIPRIAQLGRAVLCERGPSLRNFKWLKHANGGNAIARLKQWNSKCDRP